MSGQLQFGGMVPFRDNNTGAMVNVRVWGAFVGNGVDGHEQEPIRQWIMNALSTSAAAYDGDVYQLPNMAHEWGGYVSQQLAPQLAQQFQAHGQIQIHGVQIEQGGGAMKAPMGAPAGIGMGAGAMGAQAMGAQAMGAQAMGAGAMGAGVDPGAIDKAANALSNQMGVPLDQAHQAVHIVVQVLQGSGALGAMGGGAYGKQAYDKQAYDKQAYDKQAYDKQAYDKQAYDKQAYDKQPDHGGYADPYGKGDPGDWKK